MPLMLKLKELLCEDEDQPVSNNTRIVTASVLLIKVFLKVCTIMLFLIMFFFIFFFFTVMHVFIVT